ncbi:MAG: prepilin-type N-terminal cleavage/methylation domain-containing protein [Chloroherpetonaceae bacterium]|nr:prepilin-type N-terminal cleavage/methylation domain-containing protein [Chthonomonadaceae bacterium]MDW8207055.1 prepilin-type N-terminal cleavage/methylation domain-containing protein [Chloroherpetonaceae bacterium]
MCSHRSGARALRHAGFSLIEVLLVVALLVLIGGGLAYFYLGRGGREKPDGTRARTPITVAKDTVCQSNLGQVRQAVNVFRAGDPEETLPRSLQELRLPAELLTCAVGGEPYQYEPETGAVRCVHPGHENF